MSIVATVTDRWSDGKRTHTLGTLAFTGNYATGGVAVDLSETLSGLPPLWFEAPVYRGFLFELVVIPDTSTSVDCKLKVSGSGSAAAAQTLTSDNTNVSNNDTVTIGTQVYTFKTSLTASTTAYQVLIGADADASLLNLIRAINLTGTPGTDYGSLTPANTSVSAASSVTAHAFLVTALVAGVAGNSIATTETSSHLSWGSTVLAGGTNETPIGTELSAAAFPTNLQTYAVPFHAISYQLQ